MGDHLRVDKPSQNVASHLSLTYVVSFQVHSNLAMYCIHRMNRVNSRNALSMMTAPYKISWYVVLLLLSSLLLIKFAYLLDSCVNE